MNDIPHKSLSLPFWPRLLSAPLSLSLHLLAPKKVTHRHCVFYPFIYASYKYCNKDIVIRFIA